MMGVYYSAVTGYGFILSGDEIIEIAKENRELLKLPPYYDSFDELIVDSDEYEIIESLTKDSGLSFTSYGNLYSYDYPHFIVGYCVSATEYAHKFVIPSDMYEKIMRFMDKFNIEKEVALWTALRIS